MMLKKIGIVLAVVVLLYFMVGFVLPDKMQIRANIEINAPIQKIYPKVANVKNWNSWAYWFITDKSLKTEYGNDFVSFDSPERKYTGKLTIVDKIPNSHVKYKIELDDMKPGLASIIFKSNSDKSVSVEWIADGSVHNVALKPFYYFVLRPMMSSQFESSLTNLKNITER